MVFVTLGAMLILSSAISINAVEPVLFVFALFSALYLVGVTACLLPGYARIRAEPRPMVPGRSATRSRGPPRGSPKRPPPGREVNRPAPCCRGRDSQTLPRMPRTDGDHWCRKPADPDEHTPIQSRAWPALDAVIAP